MSLMARSCDGFSSPVPPPLVMVSASQNGSLSAGTSLTLSCTTTLSQFVNDGEEVNTVWTGPAMNELSSGLRISITNAVDSTLPYVSELSISTLDAAVDNGTHSCTVTVTPGFGRESFVSASTILSQEQTVEVMGKNDLSQSVMLIIMGVVLCNYCKVNYADLRECLFDLEWVLGSCDQFGSVCYHCTSARSYFCCT